MLHDTAAWRASPLSQLSIPPECGGATGEAGLFAIAICQLGFGKPALMHGQQQTLAAAWLVRSIRQPACRRSSSLGLVRRLPSKIAPLRLSGNHLRSV